MSRKQVIVFQAIPLSTRWTTDIPRYSIIYKVDDRYSTLFHYLQGGRPIFHAGEADDSGDAGPLQDRKGHGRLPPKGTESEGQRPTGRRKFAIRDPGLRQSTAAPSSPIPLLKEIPYRPSVGGTMESTRPLTTTLWPGTMGSKTRISFTRAPLDLTAKNSVINQAGYLLVIRIGLPGSGYWRDEFRSATLEYNERLGQIDASEFLK